MNAYFRSEVPVLEELHRTLGGPGGYDRRVMILLDRKDGCAHADLYAGAFKGYLEENLYGVAAVTFKQTKQECMSALLENRDYCFFDVYTRYYSSKHISRISGLIDDCMAGRKALFRSKFEDRPGHYGDGPRYFIFCTNDLDNLWFITAFGRDHASIIDVTDIPDTCGYWNVTPQYLGERFRELDAEQAYEGQQR